MGKRWTLERAKELFKQRGCELLETEYINDSTKMKYIASCGHEHSITLNNFSHGKGDLCVRCRRKANAQKESLSDSFIRSEFENAGCTVLSPVITGGRQKVEYVALCGHVNLMDYSHFRYGIGRVCSACSKSVSYKLDYVREMFENSDCELLEEEYINCKTPMRYIAQCGHESTISFDVFLNCQNASKRCRMCHKHTYHEEPIDRNRTASKVWRKAVYERDGWTCQACGHHGGELNAHHLEAYDTSKEKRFEVENGVTLCQKCHLAFHSVYGFGGNTKEQFQEWIKGIPRYVGEVKGS